MRKGKLAAAQSGAAYPTLAEAQRTIVGALGAAVLAAGLGACVTEGEPVLDIDAAVLSGEGPVADAGPDAEPDAPPDAGWLDGVPPPDAAPDSGSDAAVGDALPAADGGSAPDDAGR